MPTGSWKAAGPRRRLTSNETAPGVPMAEMSSRARRRARETSDHASGAEEKPRKARRRVEDEARDANGRGDSGHDDSGEDRSSGGQTITSELKETFREAAIEVLRPVMR